MKCPLIVLAVFAFAPQVWADMVGNAADPRLLSTIDMPRSRVCASDVSEDGHQVFTICDAKSKEDGVTPSGPAKLYIHDITDLRQPKLVNQTDISELAGYRLIARNGILFYQQTVGKGIALVDARHGQRPKAAGNIDAGYNEGFKVSDDARYIGVKSAGSNFTYYDISNPFKPSPVSQTIAADAVEKGSGIWSNTNSLNINGIETNGILDRRDGRVLVTDKENTLLLHLYAVSETRQPERLATFSPGPRSMWTHIIPHQQAVIIESQKDDKTYQLQLMLAQDSIFTPARLKSIHDQLQIELSPCLNPSSTIPVECYRLSEGLAELRDAGIENLLTNQPVGLTVGERILMLNNYGYWLSLPFIADRQSSLDKAAIFLRKTLELSPKRASAWLNLGDSYRAAIPFVATDTVKAKLWNDAMASYSHYKELSGKDAASVAELATFDLPRVLSSSKDVCAYIAEAANKGKTEQITSTSGKARANGKEIAFTVDWAGGFCATKRIWAAGCSWTTCFDNEERLKGLSFADGGFGGSVMIVPFKGKSYTAVEGPGEVVDPNKGPVCDFKATYKPKLVENENPSLCEKFLKGEIKPNVEWTPLKDKEIEKADINLARDYAYFGEAAEAKFDGQTKTRVGHFSIASGAGCGCNHNGIAVIGASQIASQTTEPNMSLIEAQGKWWHCGGADAGLVEENGITYVEAWGEGSSDNEQKPRVLLQQINGSFKPICRIEQVKTVEPAEVKE